MGMPRGSRWKRLAVFSDVVNADKAGRLCEVLHSERFEVEWWERSVPRGRGPHHARNPMYNLERDASPIGESWLMVRYGDWPSAYLIAKQLGVTL